MSTILSLFLVMTLHPDIQKMAQNELDDVVGNRLPNFSDKEQLPLIVSISLNLYQNQCLKLSQTSICYEACPAQTFIPLFRLNATPSCFDGIL